MLTMYFIFCILFIYIGKKSYDNYMNPITIYTVVWFAAFFAHECSYVEFDYISLNTFMVIVVTHFVFCVGCIIGKKFIYKTKRIVLLKNRSDFEKKGIIQFWIVFLTLVSYIEIIYDFIITIREMGLNIFLNFAKLYKMQISSETESALSLSSLLFVIAPLMGIYLMKYGWNKCLILPIIGILLYGLNNGSRGSLVIIIILFLASATLYSKEQRKLDQKKKKFIYILGGVFAALVLICTKSRSVSNGLTSSTSSILSFSVTYLGGGIGCLDKYLQNPVVVDYPQYFWRVPYIVLNKIGLCNVDTTYHIPTYFIPFPSNVITYIGELYHDFQSNFYIIVFLLAFIMSVCFCKAKKYNLLFDRMIYSGFFAIIVLSFFANFGHSASIWYVFIIGGFITYSIDYKFFKQ